MNIRLLFCLGLFSAFLAAVACLPPSWAEVMGQPSQRAEGRSTELISLPDPEFVVVAERVKAKDRITSQVVAGEMGLLEAAAWFDYLNNTSEWKEVGWRKLPGRGDGEKLCRQVIFWVKSQLQGKGANSLTEALIEDLEEELKLHIECNGTVVLPKR